MKEFMLLIRNEADSKKLFSGEQERAFFWSLQGLHWKTAKEQKP